MAGIKLCTIRKADHPFYISSISLHVGSAEELAFFLWKNPWLIDASLLAPALTRWIAEELDLSDTALLMESAMRKERGEAEILRPFFEAVGFLTKAEWKKYADILSGKAHEPSWVLKKKRGDALAGHRKLSAAEESYHEALEALPQDPSGALEEFSSVVWYNLGVCAVHMLDGDEGIRAFKKAYELHPVSDNRKSLMLAMRLFYPSEKYRAEADKLDPSEEELAFVEEAYSTPVEVDRTIENPYEEVRALARTYHAEA